MPRFYFKQVMMVSHIWWAPSDQVNGSCRVPSSSFQQCPWLGGGAAPWVDWTTAGSRSPGNPSEASSVQTLPLLTANDSTTKEKRPLLAPPPPTYLTGGGGPFLELSLWAYSTLKNMDGTVLSVWCHVGGGSGF